MNFDVFTDFLSWKSAFFMLLTIALVLHLANSAAILQLVAGLEGKEGKSIPKANKWKLVTILPFAALYYTIRSFFSKEKK